MILACSSASRLSFDGCGPRGVSYLAASGYGCEVAWSSCQSTSWQFRVPVTSLGAKVPPLYRDRKRPDLTLTTGDRLTTTN